MWETLEVWDYRYLPTPGWPEWTISVISYECS